MQNYAEITQSREVLKSGSIPVRAASALSPCRSGSNENPLTVGQKPHTAITTDFNGDGHADLAATNRRDGTVSILLGNGQGAFSSHAVIPIAVLPEP